MFRHDSKSNRMNRVNSEQGSNSERNEGINTAYNKCNLELHVYPLSDKNNPKGIDSMQEKP